MKDKYILSAKTTTKANSRYEVQSLSSPQKLIFMLRLVALRSQSHRNICLFLCGFLCDFSLLLSEMRCAFELWGESQTPIP